MSEFKGSIGPWEHYGPSGYQHSMGGYVESGDGKVCDVSGFDVGSDKAKANARLIAAAPELLECCLRIQAMFRQAGIESKSGSLNPVEDNAAQIDAVILKALGQ